MFLLISSWIGWLSATDFVYGQTIGTRQSDSLQALYNRSTGAQRAQLAIHLSGALAAVNRRQAQQYALEGLSLLDQFPATSLRLTAVRNLASIYALGGQVYQADSCYKVAIRLAKTVGNEAELINLLMSLATTCADDGRNLEALPLLREALECAAGPKHEAIRPLLVNQLGNIHDRLGDYRQALTYFHRALQEAECRRDQNVMGLAEDSMAGIYAQLGNPQLAIPMLNRAVEHYVAANKVLSANRCRLQIASNYLKMNRPDSARSLTEQGMREARETKSQTQLAMAHVLMARLSLLKKKAALGKQHARKALALVRSPNEDTRVQALMYLATANSALGRSAVAVRQARTAVAITQQLTNRHERCEANGILADVLEAAGRPAEALRIRKRNEALTDSLHTAGFRDQLAYLQVTYDTEKKEQQLAFSNRENTLRVWHLRWLAAGLLFTTGMLAVVLALYRLKRRDAQRIQRQNEQIERQSGQLTLLMRELHHRVKNNLQIVSSLLSLQSGKLVDQQARAAVREGQSRVEAISILHQRLYTTDDVTTLNFSSFVNDLVTNLMAAHGYQPDSFDLTLNVTQQRLDTDTAVPLGLIIHELVSNAFKYAYGAVKRPALTIRLESVRAGDDGSVHDTQLRLTVQDNGPGLPADHADSLFSDTLLVNVGTSATGATTVVRPFNRSKTFGMQLIHALAKQLRATCQFRTGNGLLFQLDMPFPYS